VSGEKNLVHLLKMESVGFPAAKPYALKRTASQERDNQYLQGLQTGQARRLSFTDPFNQERGRGTVQKTPLEAGEANLYLDGWSPT